MLYNMRFNSKSIFDEKVVKARPSRNFATGLSEVTPTGGPGSRPAARSATAPEFYAEDRSVSALRPALR
jgi:hypothetical protein